MTDSLKYEIKRLGAEDLELMEEILDLFGEEFEEKETYGANRPGKDYMDGLLGRGSFIALAAVSNERVIGALCAYEFKKFEQERSEIYIYDLAVAKEFRRKGVATALINAVQPIAREMGAWVIFIQAEWDDEAPVALYTKLGKKENIHHFDIPVKLIRDHMINKPQKA